VPAEPDLALGHSLGGLTLALAVERLRPARAVYEDPAWRVVQPRSEVARANFAVQKGWGRAEVAAANPRWPDADIDAKLAALRCWDPETVSPLAGGWDHTPDRAVVPSLLQLADPSELVPPDRAEELRRAGFEVRVVPGAGHSIHRDDYEGFLASLDGWI
jgi:pimeloyl-ACP methyl ester carboxylesterase